MYGVGCRAFPNGSTAPDLALPAAGGRDAARVRRRVPRRAGRPPEIVLEGTYLAVAVAVAVPIRRLGIGVLEFGWMLFLFGRYIDFLDELFVESEPLVEPYLSGLLVVVSFSVLLAGTYALLTEYREQLDALDARNEELELKNAAIEEAPIGITVADMRRDDEPLVVVNDGFARLTGYEVERTLGTNCRFLQGEGTSEELVARMRRRSTTANRCRRLSRGSAARGAGAAGNQFRGGVAATQCLALS